MTPTLNEGEIVIGVKGTEPGHGQLCAFRCGDQILIKRVISVEGDYRSVSLDSRCSDIGCIENIIGRI